MSDNIRFEILADGTVKFTTDAISPANHASADDLLEQLKDTLGGPVEVTKRTRLAGLGVPLHVHNHVHQH